MDFAEDLMDHENFHTVVYCSYATDMVTAAELGRILQTSQANNSRRGLTGLLVYGNGMFLQWLEGARQEVEELMTTLEADRRHRSVIRLQVVYGLTQRTYPGWAMRAAAPGEIREIMRNCLCNTRGAGNRELILSLIGLLDTPVLAPLKANLSPHATT